MSNENYLALSPWSALLTKPGMTRVLDAEGHEDLTLEKLGAISEWLAVAWENVAGEEYKPVVITEGGYVADLGVELGIASDEVADFVDTVNRLERDCE